MNNYEKEKVEFEENFREYQEKRIVLYGIGRFSATLIPMLNDWTIVGLMDKDPEKIGTYVYGLPIVDPAEVENKADLIIINTSGTYWDLIFQRIKHLNIPIYYRNGRKAEDVVVQENIEYWNSSFLQLKNTIASYDIISFDFFDTLFCRRTYMPSDIWGYVGDSLAGVQQKERYLQLRKSVYGNINKETVHISEIYEKMGLDISALKEIEVENKFVVPRHIMISLLKESVKMGKDIYVISDMYLPLIFFANKLKEYDIELSQDHIWISCEHGFTKRSGELWEKFRNEIVKDKTALHIGDNMESDIDNFKKYAKGDAYFIMSQEEMLRRSAVNDCLRYANNDYHNMVLGLCISQLFNNPFSLCDTRGKVKIDSRREFGYCVFGPIIFTFIIWLLRSVEMDSIHQLCFLGRDGFFLKQNFEYIYKLVNCSHKMNISYMETSRQILMCASIEDESDFDEYVRMPYEGRLYEFFEDRLDIKLSEAEREVFSESISMPQDYEKVIKIIPQYKDKIIKYVRSTKREYKEYLKAFNLENQDAIVDLGFYGTTQHYLSKLLNKEFIGYYIVANQSNSNVLNQRHVLKSCTHIPFDESCKNTSIYNMLLVIESFLTSPHGMVRSINQEGRFICAPDMNNQIFFEEKIEINEGIKRFVNDMVNFHGERVVGSHIYIDNFIDNWYGLLLKNCIFSEEVKHSFYNDNAFIHRRQEKIFGDDSYESTSFNGQ